jgi:hypothetical protein
LRAFQNAAPRISDHETLVATFVVRGSGPAADGGMPV